MRGIWVLACMAGEAAGIAVVALAYAAVERAAAPAAPAILAAGLWEGLTLGAAQSLVLGRAGVCAGCWTLSTALAAVAGYGLSLLGGAGQMGGEMPPLALILAGTAVAGAVMGALIGAAQGVTGRGIVAFRPWVARNALGWALALPVIMAGATLVPAGMGHGALALVGAVTGALAGALLGLATAPALPAAAAR
jgi:hypothetical protein